MNDRENIACQYVLNWTNTYKGTSLLEDIENFINLEIFPITLEEYSILCHSLLSNPYLMIPMMIIHMVGEKLKKQMPDYVSEIEQERVKYLTLKINRNSPF